MGIFVVYIVVGNVSFVVRSAIANMVALRIIKPCRTCWNYDRLGIFVVVHSLPTTTTITKMPKPLYSHQVLQGFITLHATMSAMALHTTNVTLPATMTSTQAPKRSYFLQVLQRRTTTPS